MKDTNYGVARKFGKFFTFIEHLIVIKAGNEFGNHYREIHQSELILKKENTSHTEATFLGLHFFMNEGPIPTFVYDKRNSCNFKIVSFPCKSSTIPSKMFFANTSAELLRICQATSSVTQVIKTSKGCLH